MKLNLNDIRITRLWQRLSICGRAINLFLQLPRLRSTLMSTKATTQSFSFRKIERSARATPKT